MNSALAGGKTIAAIANGDFRINRRSLQRRARNRRGRGDGVQMTRATLPHNGKVMTLKPIIAAIAVIGGGLVSAAAAAYAIPAPPPMPSTRRPSANQAAPKTST